jgi:hypothetical protein
MAAISSVSIASSTASNWLKEAQSALLASENPGGMMGTLQNSRYAPGSVKSFLATSQSNASNLALISQNTLQAAADLTSQMAAAAVQKRNEERVNAAYNLVKLQTNYTPPKGLDPIVYFGNGSWLDTSKDILTLSDGKQIDTKTGKEYVDEKSLIRMANGAYLDTKNNVLHMADGTKIDSVTGLAITT